MSSSSIETKKDVVILGGSYGGLSIAHYLLQHAIPQLSNHRVVLISASSEVICRPACPRALISDDILPQEKLFVKIPDVLARYPEGTLRFIQGTATHLNHSSRKVTFRSTDGKTDEIDFHALVIATGASTASPLLGLNQDETFLRNNWAAFREALPSAKRIVVAGGGPTGVETAGELGEYLNGRSHWFGSPSTSHKVSITVVTSASQILPHLRPSIAAKAERYLAQVGVNVIKDAQVVSMEPPGAGTESALTAGAEVKLSTSKTLLADLYIPAIGTKPNTAFIDQSLLTADGRVDTNATTLRVDKAGPRIYAIGDAASCSRPAVHLILAAVPVLGANITRDLLLSIGRDINGIAAERFFQEDHRETQLVPIGNSKGVGAMMGWSLPSFLVWLIKGRDYWLWTTGKLWSGKQWA